MLGEDTELAVIPRDETLIRPIVYLSEMGCPWEPDLGYKNNDTLAVVMFSADGELYGEVTVNLNHPMQSKRMAFLDENNMPGMKKGSRSSSMSLILNLLLDEQRTRRSGVHVFCEHRLNRRKRNRRRASSPLQAKKTSTRRIPRESRDTS